MMAPGTPWRALSRGFVPLLIALAACETPIADRLLAVDAKGFVLVFMFRDDNLSGGFNGTTDVPVTNADFGLRMRGATVDDAQARTDTAGYTMVTAVAGRYTLGVTPSVLGDTLEVRSGNAEFTIAATDTVRQDVALTYKTVTPAVARTTPQNRHVFLSGIALNAPGAFGDSTVHVRDETAAIRAIAVRPGALVAGDSVLFLGRLMALDGQPVFDVASQYVRGHVTVLPDTVSAAIAASADGGARDASLVRILNATIADTATDPAGNRVLTVDDGSGAIRVVLARNQNWAPINQFILGAVIEATGLLVPDPANNSVWVLKPRARSDLLVF